MNESIKQEIKEVRKYNRKKELIYHKNQAGNEYYYIHSEDISIMYIRYKSGMNSWCKTCKELYGMCYFYISKQEYDRVKKEIEKREEIKESEKFTRFEIMDI